MYVMNNINESEFPDYYIQNPPYEALDIAQIALESANVGIWIIDEKSRIFLPSKRTKELFGFLPNEEMSFEDAMSQVAEKQREKRFKSI